MNQPQFFITRVDVIGPSRLALSFADGQRFEVELADIISRYPTLAPLADPAVFAQVALDEWQRGVVFAADDDLDLASDNLRALGVEQAGGFSHQHTTHVVDISQRLVVDTHQMSIDIHHRR